MLLVGLYAQRWHLGADAKSSLGETVGAWRDVLARSGTAGGGLPRFLPLPHPSWRNNAWLKKNPWFEVELVPRLQQEVRSVIGAPGLARDSKIKPRKTS